MGVAGSRVSGSLELPAADHLTSPIFAWFPNGTTCLLGSGNEEEMDVWTCGAPPGNGRMWGGVGGQRQRQLKVSGADNGHCVRGTGGALGGQSDTLAGMCQACLGMPAHCSPCLAGFPVGGSLPWQPKHSEHCGSRVRVWTSRREREDGERVRQAFQGPPRPKPFLCIWEE